MISQGVANQSHLSFHRLGIARARAVTGNLMWLDVICVGLYPIPSIAARDLDLSHCEFCGMSQFREVRRIESEPAGFHKVCRLATNRLSTL